MKQPDLGKKIAELRKARGLTQEELVETCNLSVRTLQRIESGEVMPRSYTLKVIFSALDYHPDDAQVTVGKAAPEASLGLIASRLGGFMADLFNLKTHTMRKISILSLATIVMVLALVSLTTRGQAQSAKKIQSLLEEKNQNLIRWFEEGNVDSIMTLYHDDACLLGSGCGKTFIRNQISMQVNLFVFNNLTINAVSVADDIAVEKGRYEIEFKDGTLIRGEYMTEWRYENKEWLIIFDISNITTEDKKG